MPLILLKTLKNTLFIRFLRKKYIVAIFIVFCLFFLWKNWNKQIIIEKSTLSVKRNFFREMAYIPFVLTKKKIVFLRWDLNSPKNAEKGIIYAIFRKKINCNKDLICFLLFSSFSIKHWKKVIYAVLEKKIYYRKIRIKT